VLVRGTLVKRWRDDCYEVNISNSTRRIHVAPADVVGPATPTACDPSTLADKVAAEIMQAGERASEPGPRWANPAENLMVLASYRSAAEVARTAILTARGGIDGE